MKNIGLSTLSIAIITAIAPVAFAGYTLHIPLEASAGGHLSNGSITLVDRSSGGSNEGSGGNGSTDPTDPTDPTTPTDPEPTDPEEPLDPVVQCSNNASQIDQVLLSSGYSDINIASYAYRMSFTEAGGEKERCTVTLNIPNSKMSPCVSNNSYRTSAASYIEANFNMMQPIETTLRYSYLGSCSN